MIRGGEVVLDVRDVGQSVRFYVETLGMKLVEEAEASAVIDAGEGFRLRLRGGGGSETRRDGATLVLFTKVPLEEAIAIFENRGVSFELERKDGRLSLARLCDPDSNPLSLVAASER